MSNKGWKSKWMKVLLLTVWTIVISTFSVAQGFNTGSNGSDGALDYSNKPAGTYIFDPSKFNPPLNPSGDNIFNFTTINIPNGITVRLSGRILHGPVLWLATGDVVIDGTVDLSGEGGAGSTFNLASRQRAMPGAGGYGGGVGGKCVLAATTPQPVSQPGDGPQGGAAGACANDQTANGRPGGFPGNHVLIPLFGGSGGGGVTNVAGAGTALDAFPYGAGGGAGGGALLIASSTSITVGINCCHFVIVADGGGAGGGCNGAAGAGGGIRLIAPTIRGNAALSARGGNNGCNNQAADGFIRLDTFFDSFGHNFNGTPFEIGSTLAVFPPTIHPPLVTVTAVNGQALPQPPIGSPLTPDVSINTTSAVTLTIQAQFIPVGTVITLHVFSDNNTDQAVQTTPLQGTFESSTATANVTFPSGFSLNFVKATWTQ